MSENEDWGTACEILNNLSSTNNFTPLLIDFGGTTLYNCGINKIEENFNSIKEIFFYENLLEKVI